MGQNSEPPWTVMRVEAVLVPAESFAACGPLIRGLNEWGRPWALCDLGAAGVSGTAGVSGAGGAEEMSVCANRLGVELSCCAVLATDDRARRLARQAGVIGIEPWRPVSAGSAGSMPTGRLRAAVESLMDRYRVISLRMLETTMREWGLERRAGSTPGRVNGSRINGGEGAVISRGTPGAGGARGARGVS